MSENQTSLPTASEGLEDFSFDGVFRELHNPQSRKQVAEAQQAIAENNWTTGKALVQQALRESADSHDIRNLTLVISELERYQQRAIPSSCTPLTQIDWSAVMKRPIEKLEERFMDLPQSVFMISHRTNNGLHFVVGRRLLSHQYRSSKIRELHCSLVTAAMLLGTLEDQRITEDAVMIYYRPLENEEKLGLMMDIYQARPGSVELVFPFPVLKPDTHTELDCPPDGWEIDEPLAEQLGEGEVLIRQYTLEFLSGLHRDDLVLFDPACSTGQFLSTMRKSVPRAKLIGQDLSPFMVKYAKKRLDEIYCGNAISPKIPEKSADVVFVRFLNSEVVKTAIAMSILIPLANTVRAGGHLVVFGHTPVLLSAADLSSLPGWALTRCVGGGQEYGGIFQFYVLKRES